jgi:thiamine pyrophosphate-dependent acetolactate synthase large subunit-like protein
VAHINFPVDMQDCASSERSKRDVPGHATAIISRGAGLPHEEDLKGAAEILNSSGNVAILAGRGALGATEELEDIAEILGAPIVKALLGKGAVPDDSPLIHLLAPKCTHCGCTVVGTASKPTANYIVAPTARMNREYTMWRIEVKTLRRHNVEYSNENYRRRRSPA